MTRPATNMPLRRQRGVALVTAIFVVTVVATATAYISFSQQINLRQFENRAAQAQSEAVRQGAIEGAITMMLIDAQNSSNDHLDELWAKTPLAGDVGEGQFFAIVTDAQGKFNLNNLLKPDGTPSTPDIAVFRRILEAQDIRPDLVDSVLDWLDKDSQRRASGAEDVDYLSLTTPYRTAARNFESIDELRLVAGFVPKYVNLIRDYLSALPGRTTININTAPDAVFKALFQPTADPAVVEQILKDRQQKPFTQKTDLAGRFHGTPGLPDVEYDVKSDYFNVNVSTQFGRLDRSFEALIHRESKTLGQLVWSSNRVLLIGTEEREQ
ncbi:MAG: type II secretion system minor pseudopilin GspK [Gammaproteobacteria bacterium]|nr:type II secretion system minor pseudopilin GspK [Gammaproteobacteria bacterium]